MLWHWNYWPVFSTDFYAVVLRPVFSSGLVYYGGAALYDTACDGATKMLHFTLWQWKGYVNKFKKQTKNKNGAFSWGSKYN